MQGDWPVVSRIHVLLESMDDAIQLCSRQTDQITPITIVRHSGLVVEQEQPHADCGKYGDECCQQRTEPVPEHRGRHLVGEP